MADAVVLKTTEVTPRTSSNLVSGTITKILDIVLHLFARVAELAYAVVSKTTEGNLIRVRISSRAPPQ